MTLAQSLSDGHYNAMGVFSAAAPDAAASASSGVVKRLERVAEKLGLCLEEYLVELLVRF